MRSICVIEMLIYSPPVTRNILGFSGIGHIRICVSEGVFTVEIFIYCVIYIGVLYPF